MKCTIKVIKCNKNKVNEIPLDQLGHSIWWQKQNKTKNASIHSKAILYTEVLVSIKIVSELLYTFFSEINKIFCRVTSNAKD